MIFSATSFLFTWNSTGITVAGITDSFGTAANQLTNPFGVTLDSLDTLFVADRGNNRVQKWLPGASNGTTVAGQFNGAPGTGLNYLTQPGNVNVDSSGNVYVTEIFNYRVSFWPSGASSGTLIAGNGRRFFKHFFPDVLLNVIQFTTKIRPKFLRKKNLYTILSTVSMVKIDLFHKNFRQFVQIFVYECFYRHCRIFE